MHSSTNKKLFNSDRNVSDPVRLVLSRLKKSKRCGGGWTGRCPAHEDRRESLSIKRGDDGRVLLYCHAGCTIDSICAELGIDKTELFSSASTPKQPKVRIVQEYEYRGEAGGCLYQKVRLEPKNFTQRRPDGEGGWVWALSAGWYEWKEWGIKSGWYKAKDKARNPFEDRTVKPHDAARWFDTARRVLYRLPELKSLPAGSCVISNEGEKACEKARSMGLSAVAVGGASNWRGEFAEYSRGFKWIIVADNDERGRQMAERQAHDCHGIAQSVKILNLPGLPPKGDLYDWFDAGHTMEELDAIIEATPEYVPTGEEGPDYQFYEHEEETIDPADRRAAFQFLKQQAVEQEEKTVYDRRRCTAGDIASIAVITAERRFRDKARVAVMGMIALSSNKPSFDKFEFTYPELYPYLRKYDAELFERVDGKLKPKSQKKINSEVRGYLKALREDQDRENVLLIDVTEGWEYTNQEGQKVYIKSTAELPIWGYLDEIDAAAKSHASYSRNSKKIREDVARQVAGKLSPFKLPDKHEPTLKEQYEALLKQAAGSIRKALSLVKTPDNEFEDWAIRDDLRKFLPPEFFEIMEGQSPKSDPPPESQEVDKSDVIEGASVDDLHFEADESTAQSTQESPDGGRHEIGAYKRKENRGPKSDSASRVRSISEVLEDTRAGPGPAPCDLEDLMDEVTASILKH